MNEQSGIQAGDGGFQVNVKGNTDLKGATIASTDKATQEGKNVLTTNTLTTSDWHSPKPLEIFHSTVRLVRQSGALFR